MAKTELLVQLEKELTPLAGILGQASDAIVEQNVSNYPIFVTSPTEIEMGIPLIDRTKQKSNWYVNASSLEEFVTKGLIEKDKLEEFQKVYKSAEEQICMFVLSEIGATFVFIPRK